MKAKELIKYLEKHLELDVCVAYDSMAMVSSLEKDDLGLVTYINEREEKILLCASTAQLDWYIKSKPDDDEYRYLR